MHDFFLNIRQGYGAQLPIDNFFAAFFTATTQNTVMPDPGKSFGKDMKWKPADEFFFR